MASMLLLGGGDDFIGVGAVAVHPPVHGVAHVLFTLACMTLMAASGAPSWSAGPYGLGLLEIGDPAAAAPRVFGKKPNPAEDCRSPG
jgi:hypothetical protein